MKRIALIFSFYVGLFSSSYGQSLIGATFPFGTPIRENSGLSLSMGGASSAANADYSVMLNNPAGLAVVDKTVLSALFSLDMLRINESSAHSNMIDAIPQRISIGIPLGGYGAIGLAYDQRTNHNVAVKYSTQFQYDTATGTFSNGLSESGGLSVWQIGYGAWLWRKVQLGASYERAYYSFDKSRVSAFSFAGSVEQPSRDSSKTQSTLNGLRLGVIVPINKLRVGLGGEYFFSSDAKTDSAVYEYATNNAVPGTAESQSYHLKFPPSLTLGLAYDFSPEWLVAGDASIVFWKFASTGNESTSELYAPSISLGGQYVPAPNLLTPKYWEIIRYRAGFRYTQLPAAKASEYTISLGVGLPLGRGQGVLDIGLEGGERISGAYPNITEDIVRIVLGFNGGRKWSRSTRSNY